MSAPGAGAATAVTLLLLTGGRSRRMGRDKASMEVDGRPLGMRPVEALGALVEEVVVAGHPVPGLGGRVVADMPTLAPAVVALLLARLGEHPELLAACCEGPHGLEPLPLALRAAAVTPLRAALARGERALRTALVGPRLGVVAEAVWRRVDPEGRCFANWNRPEEVGDAIR
jgi:molybdopterin-guanine dinucleotide biosynthesis protein A